MATNNNLGFDPANMGIASTANQPAPAPVQAPEPVVSGLDTALQASKLAEQQAKSVAAANNAGLAASQAKNAEFETKAKTQELGEWNP